MILTDPEWQAVLLSLKVSSLAVALSLPFGIFFAWLLVRRRFPGKALLDSVLHLPLVLPPVVVGYLLLISMGRRGFIGEKPGCAQGFRNLPHTSENDVSVTPIIALGTLR